jgi:hypothetical protein
MDEKDEENSTEKIVFLSEKNYALDSPKNVCNYISNQMNNDPTCTKYLLELVSINQKLISKHNEEQLFFFNFRENFIIITYITLSVFILAITIFIVLLECQMPNNNLILLTVAIQNIPIYLIVSSYILYYWKIMDFRQFKKVHAYIVVFYFNIIVHLSIIVASFFSIIVIAFDSWTITNGIASIILLITMSATLLGCIIGDWILRYNEMGIDDTIERQKKLYTTLGDAYPELFKSESKLDIALRLFDDLIK